VPVWYWPAIYWSLPSSRFDNIAEAASTQEQVNAPLGEKATPLKSQLFTHSLMSETYLKSASAFANGLERQVKNRDIPLADAVVKSHLSTYVKEIENDIKGASIHLEEFSGSIRRAPASNISGIEKQKSSFYDNIGKAKAKLQVARDMQVAMANHLNDNTYLADRGQISDDASRLVKAVQDATAEVRSLNNKI
jgi:hypothetical protein